MEYIIIASTVFEKLGYIRQKEIVCNERKIPLQKHCIGLLRCVLFNNKINKYLIKLPKQVGQYDYSTLDGDVRKTINKKMNDFYDETILTYIIMERLFGIATNGKLTEYILEKKKSVDKKEVEKLINESIRFVCNIPITLNGVEILKEIVKESTAYLKKDENNLNKEAYNLEKSAINISDYYKNYIFVFNEVAKRLFGNEYLMKIEKESLEIINIDLWDSDDYFAKMNNLFEEYRKYGVECLPQYGAVASHFKYRARIVKKTLVDNNNKVDKNIRDYKVASSNYLDIINNKDSTELRRIQNAKYMIEIDKLVASLNELKIDILCLDIKQMSKIKLKKENYMSEAYSQYGKIAKEWFRLKEVSN